MHIYHQILRGAMRLLSLTQKQSIIIRLKTFPRHNHIDAIIRKQSLIRLNLYSGTAQYAQNCYL